MPRIPGVNKSKKMKILQLKLNHYIAAQVLLKQTMFESTFKIALLSEPRHNSTELGWITDANNKASIILKSADLIQKKSLNTISLAIYCLAVT